jgi:hypothetical protein
VGQSGEREKKGKWEGKSGQDEVGSVNRKRIKKKKRRKLWRGKGEGVRGKG